MTLNHSKTWPVSTMAVVQLRVSPQGGQYEIIESERYEEDKPIVSVKEEDIKISDDGLVVPLLEKHLELFTKMASVPNLKTTIRTDTVSTILDPTDFDSERNEVCEEPPLKSPTSLEESVQKFHVLALARIEETGVGVNADDDCGGVDDNLRRGGGHHVLGRRPSIKVDNWDFIYTERGPETQIRCPVHHYALSSPNGRLGSSGIKDSLLPPELPLDARKTTTLRRHYYPEGGWGWVVATCAVLVHVLNHGVQLAYSQLVSPGTEKFRVEKVHFADDASHLIHTRQLQCGGKLSWLVTSSMEQQTYASPMMTSIRVENRGFRVLDCAPYSKKIRARRDNTQNTARLISTRCS